MALQRTKTSRSLLTSQKAQSLSKSERKSTAQKKKREGAKGKKVVSNTKAATVRMARGGEVPTIQTKTTNNGSKKERNGCCSWLWGYFVDRENIPKDRLDNHECRGVSFPELSVEKKIVDEITQWTSDVLEKPSPFFNNLPACPYAKQALMDEKVAIIFKYEKNTFRPCIALYLSLKTFLT